MMNSQVNSYLCIEGCLGSGKTSLAEKLSIDWGSRQVLERFDDNPFLPYFYQDPERYAFTVELFFMTERHKHLTEELLTVDLFQPQLIADYSFTKTLLFARKNLSDLELKLFQQIYFLLEKNFPSPDLMVYLHRPVEELLQMIRQRGRDFEMGIDTEYLTKIQDSYFEYFSGHSKYPVLVLDVGGLDFVSNPDHYEEVRKHINKEYLPGVHYVRLVN